ncbi:unnamed protein product [Dovyalis caffra]|uniref:Uncharacterized protein n=1 Tax=Dovyalis caffra TaxID=77055 RepID=A0AAV1R2Q7_9ROSI|nr:unnamed protein product [Dovyalis caffra]
MGLTPNRVLDMKAEKSGLVHTYLITDTKPGIPFACIVSFASLEDQQSFSGLRIGDGAHVTLQILTFFDKVEKQQIRIPLPDVRKCCLRFVVPYKGGKNPFRQSAMCFCKPKDRRTSKWRYVPVLLSSPNLIVQYRRHAMAQVISLILALFCLRLGSFLASVRD